MRISKQLRNDLILVGICLLAALCIWMFSRKAETGDRVVVRVDGAVVAEYALSADGEYSLNGGTNLLVIEQGSARLIDADCPDKLCVRQGRVRKVGACITCLPNRLTVTVEGKKADVDLILK